MCAIPGISSLPPSYREAAENLFNDWNARIENYVDKNKCLYSNFLPRSRLFSAQMCSAFRKQHKILAEMMDVQNERDFWRFCISELARRYMCGDKWIVDNADLLHLIRQSIDRYGKSFLANF